MPTVRAQTTFQYFTLLPEDVSTNVSYWQVPESPGQVVVDEIMARLNIGYDILAPFLSPVISPRQGTVKMYDLSTPVPRQPILGVHGFSIPAGAASTSIPQECCAVLSYNGVLTSGYPPARSRGRMFIGPLSSTAITAGSSTAFPRLSSSMITAAGNFAQALRTPVNAAASVVWSQYSTVDSQVHTVDAASMDDEVDTQRRRGARATYRQNFTLV